MDINTALSAFKRLPILLALVLTTTIFAQAPASAGSRYACPSGHFCVWTENDFNGTRYEFDNVDAYNLITANSIGSAFNNRSKRTYLNEGSGASSTWSCFGAYDYDAVLSSWQRSANSAFLSTYTNCPS